jgi:hypothetical protein
VGEKTGLALQPGCSSSAFGSGRCPGRSHRNCYALVVGVGKFKNGITPLQYSVRDATLFYRFLIEQAGFTKNDTYFLADQNARGEEKDVGNFKGTAVAKRLARRAIPIGGQSVNTWDVGGCR